MAEAEELEKLTSEFETGIAQEKCRKCGCMKGALEEIRDSLAAGGDQDARALREKVETWLGKTQESLYTWLGCKHCYPAVAMNRFYEAFPGLEGAAPGTCDTGAAAPQSWPPVPGEYFVLSEHKTAPVAVSTLASITLAEELARLAPRDLCMVGKTETENIGIEKVIQNTVTNPSIHYLIVAGKDPEGHRSGATLLSLCESGVDGALRVIGSPGQRPVLKNVTPEEIEAFRSQVTLVDMIGCEDAAEVVTRIGALSSSGHLSCSGKGFARVVKPVKISTVEVVRAQEVKKTALDKEGYFVILPLKEKGSISVDHYSNDNRLLRIIEGTDAVSLYRTIVANGWVTQLTHAAYLGKELERAELSMKLGFKYVQDGA